MMNTYSPPRCFVCKKICKTRDKLNRHESRCLNIKCDDCDRRFSQFNALVKHKTMKRCRANPTPEFTDETKNNFLTQMGKRDGWYRCSKCNQMFRQYAMCLRHEIKCENTPKPNKKVYRCKYCKKIFLLKTCLKSHKLSLSHINIKTKHNKQNTGMNVIIKDVFFSSGFESTSTHLT